MTVSVEELQSLLQDREKQIVGSKFRNIIRNHILNMKSAIVLAYTIVKGAKWFLKVRRIRKFLQNYVPFDVLKYLNEENNKLIKEK